MKKQKKQTIILLCLFVVVMIAYFGIRSYSEWSREQEKKKEEAEEIHVTAFAVADVERFNYNYQDTTLIFVKQENAWIYEADNALDIDEDSLEDMIRDAVILEASEKIENVTDLSQYGLEEPANSIGFTVSGKDYVLHIGDYNNILDEYYVYLSDDESTVYMVSSTFKAGFNTALEELIVEEEEETEAETEEETESEIETEAE